MQINSKREYERNEQAKKTHYRFESDCSDIATGTEIRIKLFGTGIDENGNRFPLFLPPQESNLNITNNTLLVGTGSKTNKAAFKETINVKGGLLVMTFCEEGILQSVEIIGGKEYGKTNAELGRVPEEKTDITEPLKQLLYAASMEEADFGSNMAVNNTILRMLGRIGIDTNRNFSVNNHSFQVKNGVIRSSGSKGQSLDFN